MPKSSGGGGSGGRSGGGGGGGGPDMTTPVENMSLDSTISNIYKTRQALSDVQLEMNSEKYQKAGWKETKPIREKHEALSNRLNVLQSSINRGEREGREVLRKGKEKKDIGPFTGKWSPHFGPNPGK